jgi:hypothetical protein
MTVSGTLSDFRIRIDAPPANNKGLRYTVRKNGINTAVTCEIVDSSSPNTSCSDTINTVSFTADTDTISIGVTPPTTAGKSSAAALVRWTAKYTQP